MEIDTLKLGLIERLMKMDSSSTLRRMEELIIQAEMESRSEESLNAIRKGDYVSLESFRSANDEWKRKRTK